MIQMFVYWKLKQPFACNYSMSTVQGEHSGFLTYIFYMYLWNISLGAVQDMPRWCYLNASTIDLESDAFYTTCGAAVWSIKLLICFSLRGPVSNEASQAAALNYRWAAQSAVRRELGKKSSQLVKQKTRSWTPVPHGDRCACGVLFIFCMLQTLMCGFASVGRT